MILLDTTVLIDSSMVPATTCRSRMRSLPPRLSAKEHAWRPTT